MAASLRLLQQQSMSLGIPLLESRLSCLHHSSLLQRATGSCALITNRRCQSRKSTKVPEDRIPAPYRVTRMAYNKLVNVLTTHVDKLETRMPKTYQVYQTFRTGVKTFIADTKQYYRITSGLWSGESMSRFTRRELELYKQFSSDLPVMGMVLIIAFAPGGVFIFPLAYMFPRYLLSHHFWTREQKEEFRRREMVKRLGYYPTIASYMYHQAKGTDHESHIQKAVNKMATSVPLTYQEVSVLKPMFEEKPFSMNSMSFNHRRLLSNALSMPCRENKLVKEALLIRYIDVAMKREGIDNMTDEDLSRACAWRGLNPDGMKRDAKLSYLTRWTDITDQVHESSISLLLHLPILLSYCQPSNKKIIGVRNIPTTPKL